VKPLSFAIRFRLNGALIIGGGPFEAFLPFWRMFWARGKSRYVTMAVRVFCGQSMSG
jgi:hypothetical protein